MRVSVDLFNFCVKTIQTIFIALVISSIKNIKVADSHFCFIRDSLQYFYPNFFSRLTPFKSRRPSTLVVRRVAPTYRSLADRGGIGSKGANTRAT